MTDKKHQTEDPVELLDELMEILQSGVTEGDARFVITSALQGMWAAGWLANANGLAYSTNPYAIPALHVTVDLLHTEDGERIVCSCGLRFATEEDYNKHLDEEFPT